MASIYFHFTEEERFREAKNICSRAHANNCQLRFETNILDSSSQHLLFVYAFFGC